MVLENLNDVMDTKMTVDYYPVFTRAHTQYFETRNCEGCLFFNSHVDYGICLDPSKVIHSQDGISNDAPRVVKSFLCSNWRKK